MTDIVNRWIRWKARFHVRVDAFRRRHKVDTNIILNLSLHVFCTRINTFTTHRGLRVYVSLHLDGHFINQWAHPSSFLLFLFKRKNLSYFFCVRGSSNCFIVTYSWAVNKFRFIGKLNFLKPLYSRNLATVINVFHTWCLAFHVHLFVSIRIEYNLFLILVKFDVGENLCSCAVNKFRFIGKFNFLKLLYSRNLATVMFHTWCLLLYVCLCVLIRIKYNLFVILVKLNVGENLVFCPILKSVVFVAEVTFLGFWVVCKFHVYDTACIC